MAREGPDAATLAAFLVTVLVLGVNFVAVRVSNAELAPFWGAALRFLLASLLLFLLVAARRLRLPRGRALVGSLLYGVLAFCATYALAYWSLLGATAGTVSVLFATLPLATLLLARLHGLERFSATGLVGGLLALLGIAAIFREHATPDAPIAYLVAGLAAALCAAEAGVVVKRFPRAHPFAQNAVAMGAGSLLLLVLSALFGEPWEVPRQPATQLTLAWLVLVGSMLAFVLYVFALGRWTVSGMSYQAVLSPLVTVAVGAWLLQEDVTWTFALGAVLVLAGVWVGAIWRAKGTAGATKPA